MIIYPAIDLKDGKCVRLSQGAFDKVTVFNDEPKNVAKSFQEAGASFIHVVDLDGARSGKSQNHEAIASIVSAINIPIQTGGGIRTMEDIEQKLSMGVERIILGTAALKHPDLVKAAVKAYGNHIAVGIDASQGLVAVEGWEEVSRTKAVDICIKMKDIGVQTIIYTDIAKDGMMSGPNVEATKEIVETTGLSVIASGGVSSIDDLERLSEIGVSGVIIGKALYLGALDLKSVIQTFEE